MQLSPELGTRRNLSQSQIGFVPMTGMAVLLSALISCNSKVEPDSVVAPVADLETPQLVPPAIINDTRLEQADKDTANWLSHGRTYSEQRYSPLDQINSNNAEQLGLAWATDLGTFRGLEPTPLIIDGVMYTSGSWSKVFALDARTGAVLWSYDPKVPKAKGAHACCDVVNLGLAAYGGNVYVGTIDGRLEALDADTGKLVWSVQTVDIEKPYTITGAPRVVKGKVIIGNGGAEYGVRGFVAAYDAQTGERAWRFYTVPRNPAEGFENKAMERAAATWTGEWWRFGGGGTVWDSMAYDPELDLLYIGVGNGSPWNQKERSTDGGDNLYLSSIVAVRPDTGEYVWHYQTTPGETWDFTATQSIVLADLDIDGKTQKALMQAPKNGFSYVLDRATGKLVSAENFVPVNWASGIDLQTGRPIENPEARYPSGSAWVQPTPFGAHNWHPMSYSPRTGLVYIPAQDIPYLYRDNLNTGHDANTWNTGTDFSVGELPGTEAERKALKSVLRGHLSAWDPVAQKEIWRVQYDQIWNGGTLATAGDLVFQGRADESFGAYNATNGDLLWSVPVGTGIVGGAVSYSVDGEQYVAVSAGWGSITPLVAGYVAGPKPGPVEGRVLAFKLAGDVKLTLPTNAARELPEPPEQSVPPQTIADGSALYYRYCFMCHGDSTVSGGVVPDLRYSTTLHNDSWYSIVLKGALAQNGMRDFSDSLTRKQAKTLRAYVIDRARNDFSDPTLK
jgi:quinohemoprotein ethanol dehydrogenase